MSLLHILQAIVGLGLLNVWLIRTNKSTNYRGQDAQTLREEFEVYGLSTSAFYTVGFLKITSALALLAGIFYPSLILPASALIAVLMLGAVSMHVKVSDPIKKMVPASAMLALSLSIFLWQMSLPNSYLVGSNIASAALSPER